MTRYEEVNCFVCASGLAYMGKGDISGAYELIHHSTTIHWCLALPKDVGQETEQ